MISGFIRDFVIQLCNPKKVDLKNHIDLLWAAWVIEYLKNSMKFFVGIRIQPILVGTKKKEWASLEGTRLKIWFKN